MAWTPSGGGDHEGEDWTISASDMIGGSHTGIGVFQIDSVISVTLSSSTEISISCVKAIIESPIVATSGNTWHNLTIIAKQKIESSALIQTAYSGVSGTYTYGADSGSTGATGSDGADGDDGTEGSCYGKNGADAPADAEQGDIGGEGSAAGDGTAGSNAQLLKLQAPRVVYSSLSTKGGSGGSGGNAKGGKGGKGGQGGQGGWGGDALCTGTCEGVPYGGGNGGAGGDGGTGGTGGTGGGGGDGGAGGNAYRIELYHCSPEAQYVTGGTTDASAGAGGPAGLSVGGDGGNGGDPGYGRGGGAACSGGEAGLTGADGGTGPTGATGALGSHGSEGSAGVDTEGDFIKYATQEIDGRCIYQENKYYGQRMRCSLITD